MKYWCCLNCTRLPDLVRGRLLEELAVDGLAGWSKRGIVGVFVSGVDVKTGSLAGLTRSNETQLVDPSGSSIFTMFCLIARTL